MANCMTILVQERPKDTDDAIHEVRHLIERFKNRLTSNNLRLSERYIKSELEVLVRLSVIGSCGHSHDFVSLFQRFPCLVESNFPSRLNYDLPTFKDGGDCEDESVLVVSIKCMDIPESVVPGYVRLYRGQDCFRFGGHLLYFSLANGRCVFMRTLGITADREIGKAVHRLDGVRLKIERAKKHIL